MKLSHKMVRLVSTIVFLFLVGYGLFQISKSRTFQFFGEITSHVDTNQKVVALTFDDAPSEYTDEILNMLAERNVQATFYVIGKNLEHFPEKGKQIAAQGNELGNHSYSHQRFLLKSQAFIKSEIEKTNELIREAGYTGEITFRPPNGKKLFGLPWYLSKSNIKTVMWDVEPDTYFPGDTNALVRYTLENVRPGSIILLHPFCRDACIADREALPKIIDGLKSEGYRFMTVFQLLQVGTEEDL